MKLISFSSIHDTIILEVETTGDDTKDFELPKHDIHFWYPFNLNFFYKYTDSKGFLYLVKEKSHEGPNYYNVDILKRTKPLGEKNGVMFNPEVYKRNKQIINRARQLGIVTIDSSYDLDEVHEGFRTLSMAIAMVKRQAEERYIAEVLGVDEYPQPVMSEEWDEAIYDIMTPLEQEFIIEFGEIYCMLSVMRKLAEVN